MWGLRLTRVRGVPLAGEALGFGDLVMDRLLVATSITGQEGDKKEPQTCQEGGEGHINRCSTCDLKRDSQE